MHKLGGISTKFPLVQEWYNLDPLWFQLQFTNRLPGKIYHVYLVEKLVSPM